MRRIRDDWRNLRFADYHPSRRRQISEGGIRRTNFRIQISDLDFSIQNSEFRIQIQYSDFRIQHSEFRIQNSDFRFRFSDFKHETTRLVEFKNGFRFQPFTISDLRVRMRTGDQISNCDRVPVIRFRISTILRHAKWRLKG